VPIHRHPEWTRAGVENVLASARTLALDEWSGIEHDAAKQASALLSASRRHPAQVSWRQKLATLFVPLAPAVPARNGYVLQLRRDLGAAYIVVYVVPARSR
jgi:hypothetical protein